MNNEKMNDSKKLFENKTNITMESREKFNQEYIDEFGMSALLNTTFIFVYFGACCIYAFLEKEIKAAILVIVGLVLYICYQIIAPKRRAKKQKNAIVSTGDFVNTYKFYKSYFTLKPSIGNLQTIYYFKIGRVVETKEYYFMHFKDINEGIIISKDGFTKGNAIEFSEFLKKKFFFKYKNRIKEKKKG